MSLPEAFSRKIWSQRVAAERGDLTVEVLGRGRDAGVADALHWSSPLPSRRRAARSRLSIRSSNSFAANLVVPVGADSCAPLPRGDAQPGP